MCTSKYLIAIALLLPGHCFAQGNYRIVPLKESDRGWALAQEEVRRVMVIKGPSPSCVSTKNEVIGKIEGDALSKLFPGWEFVGLSHSQQWNRECPDSNTYSQPGPSRYTIAIPPESSTITWNRRTSGFDSLLVVNGIRIRTLEEARLVWDGYCQFRQNGWDKHESKRFSEDEWRLGITSYDQTVSEVDGVRTIVKNTHYVQVKTDPKNGRIISVKSHLEQSKKRKEHVN